MRAGQPIRTASMPTSVSCPLWSLRDKRGRALSREHPKTPDGHPIATRSAKRLGPAQRR
jgi:hypothetical protein